MSDRPDVDQLARFLERVLGERGDDLEFVVLFGSMAKGNWSLGSDYDVLVGLRVADAKRLIDRIGDFDALVDGNVQVFPYARPEWELMAEQLHPLLLEVLEHGIVLFDRGGYAALRARFAELRGTGVVTPLPSGWRIAPERAGNCARLEPARKDARTESVASGSPPAESAHGCSPSPARPRC